MSGLTFYELIETVANEVWGFLPNRDVKPIHFANDLFRFLTGKTGSPTKLQEIAGGYRSGSNPKTNEQLLTELGDYFEYQDPADALERLHELRGALDLLLSQDRALYAKGPFSVTLSHYIHISTDPSGKDTGKFIGRALLANGPHHAVEVIRECLCEGSDGLFYLTAPLLREHAYQATLSQPSPPGDTDLPRNSPVPRIVQSVFGVLVQYRRYLDKTAFLQRVVILGAFCVMLQIANSVRENGETSLIPILLCAPQPTPDIREASRGTLHLARQRIERAFEQGFEREMIRRGQDNCTEEEYWKLFEGWLPSLHDDRKIREHRRDARVWDRFSGDFSAFLSGADSPFEAFVQAATRAAFYGMQVTGGASPEDFHVFLGRGIGLVYPRKAGAGEKYYRPDPQFLDTLVTSLVEPEEEISLTEFWERAWKHFGIISGYLGTVDARRLASFGIRQATPQTLWENGQKLLQMLIRMGYATQYPDDIAMIRGLGGRYDA